MMKYMGQNIRAKWLLRIAAVVALMIPINTGAQVVLIGDNMPHGVVNDGDFTQVRAQWRQGVVPPFWSVVSKDSPNAKSQDATIGGYRGVLFSSNRNAVIESRKLDTNPLYQSPKEGDILNWEFGADLEYRSKSALSLSLMFGDRERVLIENVALKGSDRTDEIFSGCYTLTAEDVAEGLPSIRFKFSSEKGIKIFVDYINISVYDEVMSRRPTLQGELSQGAVIVSWSDESATPKELFALYRRRVGSANFVKIYEGQELRYEDRDGISGVEYQYVVTRRGEVESAPSNMIEIAKNDAVAPPAPEGVRAQPFDSEVLLTWDACREIDFASYSVSRDGVEIARGIKPTKFEDILAPKMVDNNYTIYAHDHSGNRSEASQTVTARVKIVQGAAFSDLILPMPIVGELRSDLWGAESVLPRDPDNGIELPDWSCWGGRPTYDPHDGKYHMMIVRWREDALKGHWEWPTSTVAHSVSDNPMGPYRIKREIAYDYKGGLGHNADIIKMRDGSFALYSLIDWDPTIFTAKNLNEPWKRLGVMDIDWESTHPQNRSKRYQYERNLTGVETEDGRIIIVTKFGATMVSEDGLLGKYRVVTDGVSANKTIPERYRSWNYEDPVMWQDEVQFHMIINAFLAKRAIYLRSKDGVNWIFEPGLAYTPDFTNYENGVQNRWDKLERPHVLQDEYGRATHLSLAVIDVDKALDYGSDNHNSKNIIIPLVVSRRLEILKSEPISDKGAKLSLLVVAEEGFDPRKELDIKTLRFGVDREVNYGRGSVVLRSKTHKRGLILEFDGVGEGLTEDTFTLKLLGKNNDGELIIGYTKFDK